MLPTAGVPFLTHVLSRARSCGIDHVVLATSYRAETFERHFGDGSTLGLEISYVTEEAPLGTGGGIRNVAGLLRSGPDDPVFILNGDVLTGHDLTAQLTLHCRTGADVTLHLTEVEDARAFGCVPTDADGRVTAFLEKLPEPVTNQINAGCYIFRRRLIDAIPAGRVVSVERETFPELLAHGALVMGFLDSSYWLDVGNPAAYVRASCDLVLGRVGSPAVPVTGESLSLDGAVVAESATVTGGTTVGAGVEIATGAVVHGSVLLDSAVVATGAVVHDSVVGVGAVVGSGSVLDGVVVGDGARIGADNELRSGARVWCDAVIPDRAVRFSSDES
jgi:mannose-1-phosphate guanylyltransferase